MSGATKAFRSVAEVQCHKWDIIPLLSILTVKMTSEPSAEAINHSKPKLGVQQTTLQGVLIV